MNKTNYLIRKETEADFFEVENLTREAFWNVYKPGCEEHFVLHCYRKNPDFIPELSLVLELDKKIIGHVMYSRSHIDADDGTQIPVMTFGPISIHPDFKRKGFGKNPYGLLDGKSKAARRKMTSDLRKHRFLRKKRLCTGGRIRHQVCRRPGKRRALFFG